MFRILKFIFILAVFITIPLFIIDLLSGKNDLSKFGDGTLEYWKDL